MNKFGCRRVLSVFLLLTLPMLSGMALASLAEAEQAYRTGDYSEALELYNAVNDMDAANDSERAAAIVGLSRSYQMTGEYDEAETVCKNAPQALQTHPAMLTQLAEVLFVTGRSSEAITLLSDVVDSRDAPLRALVNLGDYLQYRGRFDDARAYLSAATAAYETSRDLSSETTALAARAHWLLGNYQQANRLFREAVRDDPYNAEAQVWWGDLFAEKFNRPEAAQSYEAVLAVNDKHVPALVGLAKATGNQQPLEQALYTNPRSAAAFVAYAELALKQQKYDDARSYLTAALPHNLESLPVITALAGIAILRDDTKRYAELEQQALAIRPGGGEFYSDIGELFANDYRFEEAVAFARQAIAIQPDYWQAYTVLGMNLIRLGKETEGREQLEFAFEKDPYNVWTNNMLKVFDSMEDYVTVNSEHFTVRMSERDATVLWPYLKPLMEDAWHQLSEKYNYTPEAPVLVEVFERRDDFAVRSVGLPDIGPLVGICFGKVITLISPDTLSANWQEIAWHEFVHVITLQMTDNRIPRWLSEGVSVYEEFQGREEWGRRQDMDVVRALREDKFHAVESMDDAFLQAQSNDDLSLAYLQSYLVVEYIVQAYGFEQLLSFIRAYATEFDTGKIITQVFDETPKNFNRDFDNWLQARMDKVDVYVHRDDSADEGAAHGHGRRNNPATLLAEQYSNEALKRYMSERIEKQPRDFQAHLQLGIVLFREENYQQAAEHLQQAKEILPHYTGYPSPPLVLSQVYDAMGEEAKRREELAYLLKYHQHDVQSALELAEQARAANDPDSEEYYLQRVLAVNPYRLEVHQRYAELTDSQERFGDSVREYEILTFLDQTDPVTNFTQLANAYLHSGQPDRARQRVLRALEIAPTYQPAQQILLEAVAE